MEKSSVYTIKIAMTMMFVGNPTLTDVGVYTKQKKLKLINFFQTVTVVT
jgi:hypothetical protein